MVAAEEILRQGGIGVLPVEYAIGTPRARGERTAPAPEPQPRCRFWAIVFSRDVRSKEVALPASALENDTYNTLSP